MLISGFKPRYVIIGAAGKRYRIAFAHPRRRIAIEFGRVDWASKKRDAEVQNLGWRVIRV